MSAPVCTNMSAPVCSEPSATGKAVRRPRGAQILRALSIPIVLFWLAVAVVTNAMFPSLEATVKANAGAMVPRDAPSSRAAIISGKAFNETDYTSAAVILLETPGRDLGAQDHAFYDALVRRLRADDTHVQSVMDLWGNPVTMSGQQSADGRAAILNVRPTGDLGDARANQATEAIRDIVAGLPKPPGLNVYVTGPAPLATDTLEAADKSMLKLTIITIVMIIAMLFIAYRSLTVALIPLTGVLIILAAARGIVSILVNSHVIGISSFAANMMVSLVLGASTDYGIFFLGRYREARRARRNREDAWYTAVATVPHVVLGSGLAISGACLCLSLTHLDYFRTLGPPCFVSMIVAVVAALTLGPALLHLGGKINYLNLASEGARDSQLWRKLGIMMAKWPFAMIAVAALTIPLCIVNLTNYKVSYNDRDFAPSRVESSRGYDAADKHFPKSQLSIDSLYIQSAHDMRNTADMISLDRIAKAVFHVPGISMVQGITRPNGRPLEHASLPYAMGSMGTKLGENVGFLKERVADLDALVAKMGDMVATTRQMTATTDHLVDLTNQLSTGTHLSRQAADDLAATVTEARDHLADFDDLVRPVRSYLYWEPHCFDIPACWAMRSLFETTDNVDAMSDELANMTKGLTTIDSATPQMVTQLQGMAANMRSMAATMTEMQHLTGAIQSFTSTTIPQFDAMIPPMIDMAQAFDNAKNDDFFFLPPDALNSPDFKVAEDFFMTPDGKGARLMIYHKGEAMSPEGIRQIENAMAAAQESIKGTSLSGAKLYRAGAASNYRDVQDYSRNDITIMMIATFGLVFLIVLVITRALVGAIIVIITVVASFAGAYGLSVLIWETVLGVQLHWLTLPIAFIVLVAVGSDYNLLLLSRYREELGAGIRTGIIRTMAGSGTVVMTAGFVFAFTMLALVSSDVVNIGQAGSTIFIGLLFDMLIVRLFLVMPLARVLGAWFWWPTRIPRNIPAPWPTQRGGAAPAQA